MEISDLSDEESKINFHKDAHWAQENNSWTEWKFQQRIENIRKYQTENMMLKNVITELNFLIEVFNSSIDEPEETDQQTQRQGTGIHATEGEKRKKNEKCD